MRVNNDISIMNTHQNYSKSENPPVRIHEKFPAGTAGEDFSPNNTPVVFEKSQGKLRGLQQAIRNAQEGISLLQTAKRGLEKIYAILQTIRELVIHAPEDINSPFRRTERTHKVMQLIQEIENISQTTEFNSKKLLNGDLSAGGIPVNMETGAVRTSMIVITSVDVEALRLGTRNGSSIKPSFNLDTLSNIYKAVSVIDAAIKMVLRQCSDIDNYQNNLSSIVEKLHMVDDNLHNEIYINNSLSAKEAAVYASRQMLLETGKAILIQANARPQSVLQLLGR